MESGDRSEQNRWGISPAVGTQGETKLPWLVHRARSCRLKAEPQVLRELYHIAFSCLICSRGCADGCWNTVDLIALELSEHCHGSTRLFGRSPKTDLLARCAKSARWRRWPLSPLSRVHTEAICIQLRLTAIATDAYDRCPPLQRRLYTTRQREHKSYRHRKLSFFYTAPFHCKIYHVCTTIAL